MRETKTIKIDDREITVKELRIGEILEFWNEVWETQGISIPEIQKIVDKLLPVIAPELTLEKMRAMAPSELRVVWDAFREVNSDFFEVVRPEDIGRILTELKKVFFGDLGSLFADSLSQAT